MTDVLRDLAVAALVLTGVIAVAEVGTVVWLERWWLPRNGL